MLSFGVYHADWENSFPIKNAGLKTCTNALTALTLFSESLHCISTPRRQSGRKSAGYAFKNQAQMQDLANAAADLASVAHQLKPSNNKSQEHKVQLYGNAQEYDLLPGVNCFVSLHNGYDHCW